MVETKPGDDESTRGHRGRKYTRPGVPRLSKQSAGMRSKSRGTSRKEDATTTRRSRSTSRARSQSRNREKVVDDKGESHGSSRSMVRRSATEGSVGVAR